MQNWNRLPRFFLVLSLLISLCAGMFAPRRESVEASPLFANANHIVISEFRTKGTSGATDEFIELYKPTSGSIDISGWEIHASNNAGGGTTTPRATIPSSTVLQSGQYYLVTNTNYVGAVTANLTYGTGITDDGGIALTLPDDTPVDQVGMHTGSFYKEPSDGTGVLSPLTTADGTANRSYERKVGGASGNCVDDDNNSTDFTKVTSNPQNFSSPFATCGYAPLSFIINEVAWAGTIASSDDEWIELYNPGSTIISLAGWRLIADDGSPDITLTGTIGAGDYFLLERGSGNATNVLENQTFTGSLGDTDEILCLRAPDGTIVDTANSDGGAWPAGIISPASSMERMGYTLPDEFLSWVTFNDIVFTAHDAAGNNIYGTPGNPNWGFTVTHTPTPTTTPTITPSPTLTPSITPTPAGLRSVIINEVAWAGTVVGLSNDEWIELYNPGSTPVDISGWSLRTADGDLNIIIPFGMSIPANGYYLLERDDDNTVSDIPADLIYTGNLSNSGEALTLYDGSETVIDTANGNGGPWPAGNTSSYGTMERNGVNADSDSAWHTNTGAIRNGKNANNGYINGTPRTSNSPTPTSTPTHSQTPTKTFTPSPSPTVIPSITPTPSGLRSVIINEIAWAGTVLGLSDDEWIELYNPGNTPINITGWNLKAADGTPDIVLNGFIPAGGYYLLERDDDNTVSDITADQIYTGTLSNTGETLTLYDGSETEIDTANGNGGSWPSGSSYTYGTMERNGVIAESDSAWHTNTGGKRNGTNASGGKILGTPKNGNSAVPTPTPSRTPTPIRTATPTRTPTRTPTSVPFVIDPRPIINEILPRPGFDWNQDGRVDVFDEFIEIKNLSPIDINLEGWKLDDEENTGSTPFTLPDVTLKPGQRIVYYGAQTNILLSDGGDTVRLINPDGKIYDAYTYSIANVKDESICRLPDGNVYGGWYEDCIPTPNLTNTREGVVPSMPQGSYESPVCELPDTIPADFLFAECHGYGANVWNPYYWDQNGWQGAKIIPENTSKWESFVE